MIVRDRGTSAWHTDAHPSTAHAQREGADQATTQLSRRPKQHSPHHMMQTSHRVSSTSSRRRSRAEGKNANRKKPIGARLESASAATKRAKAAWEKARAKYQEAEAGVAAAADTLVNALEAEKVLRE